MTHVMHKVPVWLRSQRTTHKMRVAMHVVRATRCNLSQHRTLGVLTAYIFTLDALLLFGAMVNAGRLRCSLLLYLTLVNAGRLRCSLLLYLTLETLLLLGAMHAACKARCTNVLTSQPHVVHVISHSLRNSRRRESKAGTDRRTMFTR